MSRADSMRQMASMARRASVADTPACYAETVRALAISFVLMALHVTGVGVAIGAAFAFGILH